LKYRNDPDTNIERSIDKYIPKRSFCVGLKQFSLGILIRGWSPVGVNAYLKIRSKDSEKLESVTAGLAPTKKVVYIEVMSSPHFPSNEPWTANYVGCASGRLAGEKRIIRAAMHVARLRASAVD